jgi:hypothetical protein
MRKRTSDRKDMVAVAGIYRKTDLLGIYCVVLYCKSRGCSNVRLIPLMFYPMHAHSQVAKEGAMNPLHIQMHPLGFYEISKKNLPPSSHKKKRSTPCHIHVLPLLKRLGWKELIFRNVCTCKVFCTVLLFNGTTAPRRPGPPPYRGFTITPTPHSVVLLWTSDRPVLTTHGTHARQTSMPPAGFEPAIPASERPHTHTLDRAAAGSGAVLESALCNSSDGFVVLTKVLFTLLHT